MLLDTQGKRLTYCRILLGLSRQNLIDELGEFTIKTIFRWENDYNQIPDKKLIKLINFFVSKGIQVSVNWMINGIGIHPIHKNIQDIETYNFDEIVYITLSQAKSYIKNFEIFQINSNFYEPTLLFGDYIGGVITNDLSNLDGKLCFFIIDEIIQVGTFDFYNNTIKNTRGTIISLHNLTFKIGQVIWMTKRF